jgi:hypothetical protein
MEEKKDWFDNLTEWILGIVMIIGLIIGVKNFQEQTLELNHDKGLAIVVQSKFWGFSKKYKTYKYNSELKEWFEIRKNKEVRLKDKESSAIKL